MHTSKRPIAKHEWPEFTWRKNCTLDSRSDRDESINRKRGGGAIVFARICPACLLRRARTFRGKALYDDAWDKTVDLLMAQVVGTRVTFLKNANRRWKLPLFFTFMWPI